MYSRTKINYFCCQTAPNLYKNRKCDETILNVNLFISYLTQLASLKVIYLMKLYIFERMVQTSLPGNNLFSLYGHYIEGLMDALLDQSGHKVQTRALFNDVGLNLLSRSYPLPFTSGNYRGPWLPQGRLVDV